MNFELYWEALRADDQYQLELLRVYGVKANVSRYASRHTDLRVIAAQSLKIAADNAWLTEMRTKL
jgi:hypothetical protein